jgi:hypothetical protein
MVPSSSAIDCPDRGGRIKCRLSALLRDRRHLTYHLLTRTWR